jgi:cytochrome c peroxidase
VLIPAAYGLAGVNLATYTGWDTVTYWNAFVANSEICADSFTPDRSPTGMYRIGPLRRLQAHAKGGYYHDGRYPNLLAVVDHYDSCFNLGLSSGQKADLVQFLKSR